MYTILKASSARSPVNQQWSNTAGLINRQLNTVSTAKQLANYTGPVKGFAFGNSLWQDGSIPTQAEIVGIEMYIDHECNELSGYTLIEEKNVTLALTSSWIHAIDYQEGDYLEITTTSGGTWGPTGPEGPMYSYPEGSYWSDTSSGYPHANEPANVNPSRAMSVSTDWHADNVPPFSLIAAVRPIGTSPSSIGLNLKDAYRLGRYSLIDNSRLGYSVVDTAFGSQSGWYQGNWYDPQYKRKFVHLPAGSLYLGFNDQLGGLSDNTGSFSVNIKRFRSVRPQLNSIIDTVLDYPHFPPYQTQNSTYTVYDFDVDISQNKWFNTEIDIQPGDNVSFLCYNNSNPVIKASDNITNNYVYPEGHYIDTPTVQDHTYDPDAANTVGWDSFSQYFACSNCRPFSLVGALVDVDTRSGSEWKDVYGFSNGLVDPELGAEPLIGVDLSGNQSQFKATIADGIQLDRESTYSSDRLPNGGSGRLLLIFNDKAGTSFSGAGRYANNSGTMHVRVIVGSGTNSRIDAGITLRSGYDFTSSVKTLSTYPGLRTTVLGSPTDKWGRLSWTPQELNELAGFRFRRSTMVGECTIDERRIDFAWLIVYWNEPGGSFEVAERESVKQKIQFAKESTKGTAANCTTRAMGFKINPNPQGDFKGWRPQGNKTEQLQMLMREWSTSSLSGIPTYDELGYILASVIGKPVSVGGTADQRNVHTFRYDPRFEQDIQTYTFEYGTPDSRAHRVTYGLFDSLGLNFSRSEADMSGSMLARAIVDGITMSGGASEVQTMTVGGSPTGGTYVLEFKGAETTALAYNANGAAIQAALNALPTIGTGGVAVTGTGPFTITFSGASLTAMQQPMIRRKINSLTGGTSPDVTFVQTTAGGFVELPLVPVLPGQISVYLSDTYATLASGKLTRARATKWDIQNRSDAYWVMDAANSSFLGHTESPVNIKTNLELQADSNGMALLSSARAGTGKFMRIEAVGPAIGVTSDVHKLTIDMFVNVSTFGNMSDNDGVYQTNFELTAAEHPTWGNALVVTLENGVVSY